MTVMGKPPPTLTAGAHCISDAAEGDSVVMPPLGNRLGVRPLTVTKMAAGKLGVAVTSSWLKVLRSRMRLIAGFGRASQLVMLM